MRSGGFKRPNPPAVSVCQLPEQVEAAIVAAKREKPNWGARKIRERLLRRLPHAVKVPACSTIHAVLDRHGLVTRATRPRTRTEGTPLSNGLCPNDLWCTDHKGEFMLADKRYCYPLTVSDHSSRYVLLCGAMGSNAKSLPLRPLKSVGYRRRCARIMAFPSVHRTDFSIFPSFRCGGCRHERIP